MCVVGDQNGKVSGAQLEGERDRRSASKVQKEHESTHKIILIFRPPSFVVGPSQRGCKVK